MAAFECVKSPGGTGFGGTSSRFARLPSRDGLVSAKNYGSPGPGAYDTPSVIGFDRSALSGVTASFSQSSFMLGSRASSVGTRSGLAGGSGEPHEVSAPLQSSVGQSHYLSQHGSSASYSIGSRFPRQRARTPGPLAYRAPSVAEVRGAVMGTDDRFGPTEGHSVKYATTPGATAYDPMHPLPANASYTFGHRFERKPVSRSPGPAADGSPQDAKLAVLSRPANFSMYELEIHDPRPLHRGVLPPAPLLAPRTRQARGSVLVLQGHQDRHEAAADPRDAEPAQLRRALSMCVAALRVCMR